jgi:hypothetical protein
MTYEQLFAGKMTLAQAIKHLRNRACTFLVVPGCDWTPCDEGAAVGLLEAKYWKAVPA